ncbi:MAG: DUF2784 domain-containing protein [Ferruginibacter sp.]
MEKYFFHFLTLITVIIHFLFILFVIAGGFLAYKSKLVRIVHIASVIWAVYAEISPGVICPLTTLENYFGNNAGLTTYKEDFITRYLIPVIYQENVPGNVQLILIGLVVIINAVAYLVYFRMKSKTQARGNTQ